ncbi:MAG: energy-coupling factor transporter transmembrane protein EcfT [Treponema sp.]|nr:energy-coupling factor transporter transmembrane protein EcfT [Treponema sp.]
MVINREQAVFRYKTIKGPLHKLPAILKLFLLLPAALICMSLPSIWLGAGIAVIIFIAFMCNFTLREQLTDLKPVFYYAALMYALSLIANIFDNWKNLSSLIEYNSLPTVFLPRPGFLRIALRLMLIVQLSALLFRTTSSMEIRDSLNMTERFIRLGFTRLPFAGKRISKQSGFVENISLFLCFIPEIFSIWFSFNLSWKARGGKQGLDKIKMSVFVLISLSFEKAALKAKAMEARRYYEYR